MATCQRCGIKLCRQDEKIGVYCYQCREKREREVQNEKLVRNLDYCRKGEGMQNAQRIYDAFVSEYPGALLTGIDVKDSGNMLLLYLDGKPSYFATMNVLTGKVNLEAYDAPISSSNGKQTSTPAKSYGGATAFSVISAFYGLFLLLFSYIGGLITIISSLVALCGCISKSKTAIVFGAVFLLLAVVFCFPYSLLNVALSLFLIALS